MMNIKDRYDHLLAVISSERFLKKQGLGNELPFFICSYDPREAVEVERRNAILKKNLAGMGITILEINLYDLCLDILGERNRLDALLEIESATSRDEVLDFLRGALDPEEHLVPAICEILKKEQYHVLFLTGVGEVYPFLRSHSVLNNLHVTAADKPLVMFFPGEYRISPEDGASLDLFARLHDDKYYRAFNIFHFHP